MRIAFPRSLFFRMLIGAALAAGTGCQIQSISSAALAIHQLQANRSGLEPLLVDPMLRITCAPPEQWDPLPPRNNLIYSHQQWRSPDRMVGVGVAYMRTPVPFSAETLVWFAKTRYSQADSRKGRLIDQWTDLLGRCWFEAENNEFHVKGYAMTRGRDAWVVYSGFRRMGNAPKIEIVLAAKSADSVAPIPRDQ